MKFRVLSFLFCALNFSTSASEISDNCANHFYRLYKIGKFDSALISLSTGNAKLKEIITQNASFEKQQSDLRSNIARLGKPEILEIISRKRLGKFIETLYLVYHKKGVTYVKLVEVDYKVHSYFFGTDLKDLSQNFTEPKKNTNEIQRNKNSDLSSAASDSCIQKFTLSLIDGEYNGSINALYENDSAAISDSKERGNHEIVRKNLITYFIKYGTPLGYELIRSDYLGKIKRRIYIINYNEWGMRVILHEMHNRIISWSFDDNITSWEYY